MIKAVIFDFFGVLELSGDSNKPLFEHIRQIKKQGLKLGIISNANQDWVSEILSLEEKSLFDDVIISFEAGCAKPESKIYEMSLKNLGVKAAEAVFVDDIAGFCDASEAVGMKAICYKDFEQMKNDLEPILNGSGADN